MEGVNSIYVETASCAGPRSTSSPGWIRSWGLNNAVHGMRDSAVLPWVSVAVAGVLAPATGLHG
jgi:hypothetical protein